MRIRSLFLISLLCFTENVFAQESDFKVSGYVDGSYNNLQRNYFTSGSFDRVFANAQNGLTLQQAAVTFAYQPAQGFGGLLNPILGYDTNIFAFTNKNGVTVSSNAQSFALEAFYKFG